LHLNKIKENVRAVIFIVVPCILICIKFIHQQMHSILNLIKF